MPYALTEQPADFDIINHMTIELIKPSDYPELAAWWTAHKWPPVPISSLPRTGLVVRNPIGVGQAAGFLYDSGTDISWVEWIVSNPDTSAEQRAECIKLLLEGLELEAKKQGFVFMWTSSKNRHLSKKLMEAGFAEVDVGVSHFIKRIK